MGDRRDRGSQEHTVLDDARIDAIIHQVMAELRQAESGPHEPLPPVGPAPPAAAGPELRHADNLFPTVDGATQAARRAFDQLGGLPLALRERMIGGMRRTARENAQVLARLAWEETGMGRLEDKIEKNLLNANKAPGPEVLTPTAWTGDDGMALVEYAPYGVIGAITPSTNPTSSVICNAISMVAAGNAVVFNGHPGGQGLHQPDGAAAEPGDRRGGRAGQPGVRHRRADDRDRRRRSCAIRR